MPFSFLLRRTSLVILEELLLCSRHILKRPFAILHLSKKRLSQMFFVGSLVQRLLSLLLSRRLRLRSEGAAIC